MMMMMMKYPVFHSTSKRLYTCCLTTSVGKMFEVVSSITKQTIVHQEQWLRLRSWMLCRGILYAKLCALRQYEEQRQSESNLTADFKWCTDDFDAKWPMQCCLSRISQHSWFCGQCVHTPEIVKNRYRTTQHLAPQSVFVLCDWDVLSDKLF